jgi:hypothetical protein
VRTSIINGQVPAEVPLAEINLGAWEFWRADERASDTERSRRYVARRRSNSSRSCCAKENSPGQATGH